jgi:hypothetical protein
MNKLVSFFESLLIVIFACLNPANGRRLYLVRVESSRSSSALKLTQKENKL